VGGGREQRGLAGHQVSWTNLRRQWHHYQHHQHHQHHHQRHELVGDRLLRPRLEQQGWVHQQHHTPSLLQAG
jgi:hypothetical protein